MSLVGKYVSASSLEWGVDAKTPKPLSHVRDSCFYKTQESAKEEFWMNIHQILVGQFLFKPRSEHIATNRRNSFRPQPNDAMHLSYSKKLIQVWSNFSSEDAFVVSLLFQCFFPTCVDFRGAISLGSMPFVPTRPPLAFWPLRSYSQWFLGAVRRFWRHTSCICTLWLVPKRKQTSKESEKVVKKGKYM